MPADGSGGTSRSSSSRERSPYYVNVQISAFSRGGAAKVNGTIAGALPATVQLETDSAGVLTRPYTIQLSTNILQPTVTANSGDELVDASRVFLNPGDAPPSRIYFGQNGPELTGVPPVQTRSQ